MSTLRIPASFRSRFVLDPFEPAYSMLPRDEFERRIEAGQHELESCCVCPRNCRVNRIANEAGVCNTGRYARVSSAFPHFGEEDCLRGWAGSGTLFFGQCSLRCVFCQNWDISQRSVGGEVPPERVADIMLGLQERGCHNINFVTPGHVAHQVIESVAIATARGLRLPIVYNTSGYDSVRSLKLLDGIVDIFMPDFKFWESETAERLAKAPDYPQRAREAIEEMYRQVGPLKFGPNGLARRGLLVRHLVMPGQSAESAAIFRWLADALSPDTYVNIMSQYQPKHEAGLANADGSTRYGEIHRRPTYSEIAAARQAALDAGLWRFDERRSR